jgi:hypothetical protein
MLDHYRITKLVNEYCHGCDRGDGERMASVYARHSWDDHGLHKMDGKEFSASVMVSRQERGDVMSHQLGQTLVAAMAIFVHQLGDPIMVEHLAQIVVHVSLSSRPPRFCPAFRGDGGTGAGDLSRT